MASIKQQIAKPNELVAARCVVWIARRRPDSDQVCVTWECFARPQGTARDFEVAKKLWDDNRSRQQILTASKIETRTCEVSDVTRKCGAPAHAAM